MMVLTRVIAKVWPGGMDLSGDFRTIQGKRVRLSLGKARTEEQVATALALVEAAAGDRKKLMDIRGT